MLYQVNKTIDQQYQDVCIQFIPFHVENQY
jgi:hypothetical protein